MKQMLLLFVALPFLVSACKEDKGGAGVTGLTLDKEKLTVVMGTRETLKAEVTPVDAADKGVKWIADNPNIADVTVVDGQTVEVIPFAVGKTFILAVSDDGGKTAVCDVEVVAAPIRVTGLTLDRTSIEFYPGDKESLEVTVAPENASNPAVSWSTSDESVAVASREGEVTAVGTGTAVITVTSEDGGLTASCDVKVLLDIALNEKMLFLLPGEKQTVQYSVYPAASSGVAVTWSSGDGSVATVSSAGEITAVAAGITTITATAASGEQAVCDLKVVSNFGQKLGVGWNLGNSLDTPGNETAWGNPTTTEAMILAIKEGGFQTIRIPVSWQVSNSTESNGRVGGAPSYTLNPTFMNRLQQVVDWAYDCGLYVIINTHHDNGYWLNTAPSNPTAMYAQFEAMWTQIANRFKDYSGKLVFEPFNEIRVHGNWTGGSSHFAVVNELNRRFVETVRATGGNNSTRWLLCPTYAAITTAAAVNGLVVPDDPWMIVSVHDYIPQSFTFKVGDYSPNTAIFSVNANRTYYEETFKRLYDRFVSQGIPVVIGEFGAAYKNNNPERLKWAETYCSVAAKYGLTCIYWDDGDTSTAMGLLIRNTLDWRHHELRDKVIETSFGK